MNQVLMECGFFGIFITLFTYWIGEYARKRLKAAIVNPLLISVICIIGFLVLFHVDYETYEQGAKYVSFFLTPATVSLAVPLYRRIELLKKYPKAIFAGIFAGVMTCMLSIWGMSLFFHLSHTQYITLLPKSITTAIALGVSEKMNGIVGLTVVAISITGILGNVAAEPICKLFHVTDPVAKGLAIGTASHAMGTSKAMELGEIEGAMSSLSIVVAGIMTVIVVPLFSRLI